MSLTLPLIWTLGIKRSLVDGFCWWSYRSNLATHGLVTWKILLKVRLLQLFMALLFLRNPNIFDGLTGFLQTYRNKSTSKVRGSQAAGAAKPSVGAVHGHEVGKHHHKREDKLNAEPFPWGEMSGQLSQGCIHWAVVTGDWDTVTEKHNGVVKQNTFLPRLDFETPPPVQWQCFDH